MSKISYSKPTVTKVGTLTDKTQGGYKITVLEVMGRRGSNES